MPFPIAPKRPHVITQHGQSRVDNYFWLRYRDDPAVMEYLHAENRYCDEIMQPVTELQRKLFDEMKARIKEDDVSAPERRGPYFYYTRTTAGSQYPIYCRKRDSLSAPEEVLLDQNALAEGKPFCRVGVFVVSPDHEKLAYSIDTEGSERYVLYFKNISTGAAYADVIFNTSGDLFSRNGVAWANDSATVFYVTLDDMLRPNKAYRHVLGVDPVHDTLVYHEADDEYWLQVGKTRSLAFITLLSRATLTSEWRIILAADPQSVPRVFSPRRPGIEYDIDHHRDRFLIVTNDNAQNFKLMETPEAATTHETWKEIIPHRPDVLVEGVAAFANHLVLFERMQGLKQVRISDINDVGHARYVPFPEPVYNVQPTENPEFQTDVVRFTYSSLITPNSVIDLHMDNLEWELKKQQEIPSGHTPTDYVTERVHATAHDGTKIPISLVYKKTAEVHPRPALLYGYGAYGISTDATFNPARYSLIDRGFVYAIAHVRGGSDLGRAWYENGRLLQKKNTFTDFIACAESLIELGYTSRDRLAIQGGSAGGLLVGACLTMRPDLFNTVVVEVPFLDIVNTMSDPSIPLTIAEYTQWGNPSDKTFFDYMMSYSPYDNIRETAYPNVLLRVGLNDPRVAYWEPAKFAAKLRALKTDTNLVLLKTNMAAGHAGASGRYDFLGELAFVYAFLITQVTAGKSDLHTAPIPHDLHNQPE